ncbi:hypothetical protein [Pseudomonas sp. NPDC089401]|uniref:hypothetical protein n=1 Tax=Pseudomonas sp. NPDC089401 TaxID=3364462 RepID=UPI0038151111
MNRKLLMFITGIAIAAVIIIVSIYISTFGLTRSHNQADWGTFGDYFGGILNPIFALFAFIGVLWSLDLQMKQIKQLGMDRHADEILQAVRDIDTNLSELSKTVVADIPGRKVLISHMAAESKRINEQDPTTPNFLAAEDIYIEFLEHPKSSGSMIGMAVREMADHVKMMSDLLKRYPLQQDGEHTPVIEYYRNKTSRLVPMLNDAGMLSANTRAFFEKTR